jgi:hypothetical protein
MVKPKKCRVCKEPFIPRSSTQVVCCWQCAQILAERKRNAQEAKEQKQARQSIREQKKRLKTWQEWFNECKTLAQKYARLRDRHDGCISCNKPANWHGQWHGSHFRPAGNFKAVALNTWNIHKSCSECNACKSGNLIEYQDKLIKKIGLERVEWLKSQNQAYRHSVKYLERYKRVMGKKVRLLQRRA